MYRWTLIKVSKTIFIHLCTITLLSTSQLFAEESKQTITFVSTKVYYWDIDGKYIISILEKKSEYPKKEINKQLDIAGSTYKILNTNGLDLHYDSFIKLLEALREWELTIDFLKDIYKIDENIIKKLTTNKHTKNHFKDKNNIVSDFGDFGDLLTEFDDLKAKNIATDARIKVAQEELDKITDKNKKLKKENVELSKILFSEY